MPEVQKLGTSHGYLPYASGRRHSTRKSGANTPDKRLPELHHQQPITLDPLFVLDSLENFHLFTTNTTQPVRHSISSL